MDQAMVKLRERAPNDVLDYSYAMECLNDYAQPRSKLLRLIKSGALIRIKKGLYVFGKPYRHDELALEMIANLIYGPSYVSLEWALSYYGLIPEQVAEVTSVTIKRKTNFNTPIGRFSYAHSKLDIYPIGITRLQLSTYQAALIASKEKALADQLIIRRGKVTSMLELQKILFEDFRIEEEDLTTVDINFFERMVAARSHSTIVFLIKLLKRLQK